MTADSQEIHDFLRRNRLGVLAAARKDGSPQQTLVQHAQVGESLIISTRATSYKYKNVKRNPKVAYAVVEGPAIVTVYGTCEVVEDPQQVLDLHKGLYAARGAVPPDDATLGERLRSEQRVVLRIRPRKYLPVRLGDAPSRRQG